MLMRPIESIFDYTIAIKDELLYGLGFILSGILIISLPIITLFVIFVLSYITIVITGYLLFISIISPKTGEKILFKLLGPKISDIVSHG
jgi:hypothetical protein